MEEIMVASEAFAFQKPPNFRCIFCNDVCDSTSASSCDSSLATELEDVSRSPTRVRSLSLESGHGDHCPEKKPVERCYARGTCSKVSSHYPSCQTFTTCHQTFKTSVITKNFTQLNIPFSKGWPYDQTSPSAAFYSRISTLLPFFLKNHKQPVRKPSASVDEASAFGNLSSLLPNSEEKPVCLRSSSTNRCNVISPQQNSNCSVRSRRSQRGGACCVSSCVEHMECSEEHTGQMTVSNAQICYPPSEQRLSLLIPDQAFLSVSCLPPNDSTASVLPVSTFIQKCILPSISRIVEFRNGRALFFLQSFCGSTSEATEFRDSDGLEIVDVNTSVCSALSVSSPIKIWVQPQQIVLMFPLRERFGGNLLKALGQGDHFSSFSLFSVWSGCFTLTSSELIFLDCAFPRFPLCRELSCTSLYPVAFSLLKNTFKHSSGKSLAASPCASCVRVFLMSNSLSATVPCKRGVLTAGVASSSHSTNVSSNNDEEHNGSSSYCSDNARKSVGPSDRGGRDGGYGNFSGDGPGHNSGGCGEGSSPSGGGDDKGNPNGNDFNYVRRPRPPLASNEQAIVVEFPVKNFWKVAKQQNDIESTETGRCRGFYYRLLIHPKGTAGTDSESSHLSVFLEAVRQDWFPDDWVFPNVRFELTVVNFRDPKLNVTSWAHWSFSSDAMSRGWQKMLAHSRLNRISGFMDEEGTVLIRGKAEPQYATLWSHVPRYRPPFLWALMPATSAAATTASCCPPRLFAPGNPTPANAPAYGSTPISPLSLPPAEASFGVSRVNDVVTGVACPGFLSSWRESHAALQLCDQIVPALRAALHADYLACFVNILYYIREFRREIFLCKTPFRSRLQDSSSQELHHANCAATPPKDDTVMHKSLSNEQNGETQYVCIIEALQSVFAEMQLWPLVATALRLGSVQPGDAHFTGTNTAADWLRHQLSSGSSESSFFLPPTTKLPACQEDCSDAIPSQFLRQPSTRDVMRALCLTDVQKIDISDPLPYIHTTLFALLHRQCQINFVDHIDKQSVSDDKRKHSEGDNAEREFLDVEDGDERRFPETCDVQDLDHTMRILFSYTSSGFLRDSFSSSDYPTSFMRVKHVHSMSRALEQSGKKIKRYPEILFIYLTQQRNTKKGELFDVPLRLDASPLLEVDEDQPGESPRATQQELAAAEDLEQTGNNTVTTPTGMKKKCDGQIADLKDDRKLLKKEKEKQRRRLRKNRLRGQNNTCQRPAGRDEQGDPGPGRGDDPEPAARYSREFSPIPAADEEAGPGCMNRCQMDGKNSFSESNNLPPKLPKWYYLYALIIREGDGAAGTGGGAQTTHTLLIRPEEDGPWFRMAHNRVEKLVPKVDFSEWKCHRDFFCTSAVYIAEDYIDAMANGDFDLDGDLRYLNPKLYHTTLIKLGVTEEQVLQALKSRFDPFSCAHHPDLTNTVSPSTGATSFHVNYATGVSPSPSAPFHTTADVPPGLLEKALPDVGLVPRGLSFGPPLPAPTPQAPLKFAPVGLKEEYQDFHHALRLMPTTAEKACLNAQGPLQSDSVFNPSSVPSCSRGESEAMRYHNGVLVENAKVGVSSQERTTFRDFFADNQTKSELNRTQRVSRTTAVFGTATSSANETCFATARSSLFVCPEKTLITEEIPDLLDMLRSRIGKPWRLYRDELAAHYRAYQLRLADAIRRYHSQDIKRILVELIAARLTLYYDLMSLSPSCSTLQTLMRSSDDIDVTGLRDTSDHLNFLMCQREPSPCADDEGHPALSECNYGVGDTSRSPSPLFPALSNSFSSSDNDLLSQYPAFSDSFCYRAGRFQRGCLRSIFNASSMTLRSNLRRSFSENRLCKSSPEFFVSRLYKELRKPLELYLEAVTDLLLWVQKDVNIYCLMHRDQLKRARCNDGTFSGTSLVSPRSEPSGVLAQQVDHYVDTWLQRIWSSASKLEEKAETYIERRFFKTCYHRRRSSGFQAPWLPSSRTHVDSGINDSNNKPTTKRTSCVRAAPAVNECANTHNWSPSATSPDCNNSSRALHDTALCNRSRVGSSGSDDDGYLPADSAAYCSQSPYTQALHTEMNRFEAAISALAPPDLAASRQLCFRSVSFWDTIAFECPSLVVPDIICSAVSTVMESRSAVDWVLVSPRDLPGDAQETPLGMQVDKDAGVFADQSKKVAARPIAADTAQGMVSNNAMLKKKILEHDKSSTRDNVAFPSLWDEGTANFTGLHSSQSKRQRADVEGLQMFSSAACPNFPANYAETHAAVVSSETTTTVAAKRNAKKKSLVRSVQDGALQPPCKAPCSFVKLGGTGPAGPALVSKTATDASDLIIDQQFAHSVDPDDFMSPSGAKDFYQARLSNFGTIVGQGPPLMPYLRNSTTTAGAGGHESTSLKNLRGLDTLLGSVGLSAGFKQLMTATRYVRISINVEKDLFGLEGFACEQHPPVTRILTAYRGMVTNRLYGILRLFLSRRDNQLSSDSYQQKPVDQFALVSSKTSSAERHHNRQDGADNVGGIQQRKPKLETSWKGTAKDSFMLFALIPEPDPSRKGRYRYVYMTPNEVIDSYCDTKRRQIDPEAPDLTVLLMMCHHLHPVVAPLSGTSIPTRKARLTAAASRANPASSPRTANRFPLPDDTLYPLLIFKWFDHQTVDLFCVGAQVCDSKKRLEDYVVDWLLPLLRSQGGQCSLPPLATTNGATAARDNINNYLIMEECHIRTCQTVRRFNAAIKKINKHTGDVIIVQLKREANSPSRVMDRFNAELMARCSSSHPRSNENVNNLPRVVFSGNDFILRDPTTTASHAAQEQNAQIVERVTKERGFQLLNATAVKSSPPDFSAGSPRNNPWTRKLVDNVQTLTSAPSLAQDRYAAPLSGKRLETERPFLTSASSPPIAARHHDFTLLPDDAFATRGMGAAGGVAGVTALPSASPKKNAVAAACMPQEVRAGRLAQKKKKKAKTNIPANTKSKIKAEVQDKRRKEVDRIQQEAFLAEVHDAVLLKDGTSACCVAAPSNVVGVSPSLVPPVAEDTPEAVDDHRLDDANRLNAQSKASELQRAQAEIVAKKEPCAPSSSMRQEKVQAEKLTSAHLTKLSSGTGETFFRRRLSLLSSKSVTDASQTDDAGQSMPSQNGLLVASSSHEKQPLKENVESVRDQSIDIKPQHGFPVTNISQASCGNAVTPAFIDTALPATVAAPLDTTAAEPESGFLANETHAVYDTASNKPSPFSTAAEAVLSTFPDGFATIMRESCLFTYDAFEELGPIATNAILSTGEAQERTEHPQAQTTDVKVMVPNAVQASSLENLKVLLNPSTSVSSFVSRIVDVAVDEIQQVPLGLRLAAASSHFNLGLVPPPTLGATQSPNSTKPKNKEEKANSQTACAEPTETHRHYHHHNSGSIRVSAIAMAVVYHIDRLFNDYLRDDKRHQHDIVCEFRKQVDFLIIAPVTCDFTETVETLEKGGVKAAGNGENGDDGVLENEADLFERSLPARQLAALELFAAAFISSDLIGTRKGLHSLTLSLLGETAATLGGSSALCSSSASVLRRIPLGVRTLQQSLYSHEGTPVAVLQQCAALCSLCFLFFILGAKRVVQLADSQAGRRYFDNIMTKLSDWLRRLSMVAFADLDATVTAAAAAPVTGQPLSGAASLIGKRRRHQLLLRHSYWALVLVLKDVVASRSPVTTAIVSRETEAALTLATLPFVAAGSPTAKYLGTDVSNNTSTQQQALPQQSLRQGGAGFSKHMYDSSQRNLPGRTLGKDGKQNLAFPPVVRGGAPYGRRRASWAALALAYASANEECTTEPTPQALQDDKGADIYQHGYANTSCTPDQHLVVGSKSMHFRTGRKRVEYVNGLPQIIEEYEKEDGEEDDEEGEEGIVSDVKHGDDVVLALDIDEADIDDDDVYAWSTPHSRPRHFHGIGKHSAASIASMAAAVASGCPNKNVGSSFVLNRFDQLRYADMRLFLDRRTGRPRVSKDTPIIVQESPTWFVTYKPAFWHCSGPSHCVDRPLDLQRLRQGDIERTLKHISLSDLQHSGKMESFHLWLMKQFPQQETIRRWTELECGLCHRIDLETSGAVLIARTRRTRDFLWDQFRRRNVHKEYLLLCHGRITKRFGMIKTRLLTKDYDSRARIKSHFTQVVEEGGEDSLTEYHVCRIYRRKKWSEIIQGLVELPSVVGEYVLPNSQEAQTSPTGAQVLPERKGGGGGGAGEKQSKRTAPGTPADEYASPRGRLQGHRRRKQKSHSCPSSDYDSPTEQDPRLTLEPNRSRMWIDPSLTGKNTENEEFSLCKCRIVTGRTHQIRVHMRHIGHPLVSDTKYLDAKKCQEDRQWCPRMFLHAAILEFADPDSNAYVESLCPLAHELVRALDTALVCVNDYEPVAMEQLGIPPPAEQPFAISEHVAPPKAECPESSGVVTQPTAAQSLIKDTGSPKIATTTNVSELTKLTQSKTLTTASNAKAASGGKLHGTVASTPVPSVSIPPPPPPAIAPPSSPIPTKPNLTVRFANTGTVTQTTDKNNRSGKETTSPPLPPPPPDKPLPSTLNDNSQRKTDGTPAKVLPSRKKAGDQRPSNLGGATTSNARNVQHTPQTAASSKPYNENHERRGWGVN